MDDSLRQKINDKIQKAKDIQRNLTVETKQTASTTQELAAGFDKVYNILRLITGISLVKMFKDAVD